MKKQLLLLVALVTCATLLAQAPQGISHQAVIRNAQGELVTGATIGIRATILQATVKGTAVFVETHAPTSNENGLITYVIGQGTPVSGTFANIDWAAGPYFLRTEADPEGGTNYTMSFTSQFLSVPYALYAEKSSESLWESQGNDISFQGGNVGLGTTSPSALLHAHGTGIGEGNVLFVGETKNEPGNPPLQGGGTRMMWYPDKAAFRAGLIIPELLGSTFWDKDSIGNGSVAFGVNTKAKGLSSIASGFLTSATGLSATALGYMTTASGSYSTALGYNSQATGSSSFSAGGLAAGGTSFSVGIATKAMGTASTALGYETIASSTREVVIGQYNEKYTPAGGTTNWVGGDRLFVIGYGTAELLRKNALTVLKNGRVGIGTNEPQARLHIQDEISNGNGLYVNTIFSQTSKIIDARSSNNTRFCVMSNGNVGIGTDNPTFPLAVNGTIRSKKVIVETGWADFVFDDEYHLRPLYEVESFIKEYNRLPEIPSAKDVEENGVSLGEISASLLHKIEELTLYTIEQQKIIDELVKQNKELMIRVTEIEKK